MSINILNTGKLVVTDGADFKNSIIKDIANPVDLRDAVNLQTLNGAVISGGWDSSTFDDASGDLQFLVASVLDFTVNLDGRYQTEAEVAALIAAVAKDVFTLELPTGATVSARIAGATPPTGWSLAVGSSAVDIVVTHATGRRVANVSVHIDVDGTEHQQMFDAAAFNAIATPDENNLRIGGLCTVQKPLLIYITFAE